MLIIDLALDHRYTDDASALVCLITSYGFADDGELTSTLLQLTGMVKTIGTTSVERAMVAMGKGIGVA